SGGAGRAHGARPVDPVAHLAHARGRRVAGDRRGRGRPAQAHGVADRKRRATAGDRPGLVAARPRPARRPSLGRPGWPAGAGGEGAVSTDSGNPLIDSRTAWIVATAALAASSIG